MADLITPSGLDIPVLVPRPAPQKTRLDLGYQDLALRAEFIIFNLQPRGSQQRCLS
jgi:hypothetical protein